MGLSTLLSLSKNGLSKQSVIWLAALALALPISIS